NGDRAPGPGQEQGQHELGFGPGQLAELPVAPHLEPAKYTELQDASPGLLAAVCSAPSPSHPRQRGDGRRPASGSPPTCSTRASTPRSAASATPWNNALMESTI